MSEQLSTFYAWAFDIPSTLAPKGEVLCVLGATVGVQISDILALARSYHPGRFDQYAVDTLVKPASDLDEFIADQSPTISEGSDMDRALLVGAKHARHLLAMRRNHPLEMWVVDVGLLAAMHLVTLKDSALIPRRNPEG